METQTTRIAEAWRAPALREDEELIFDEPGRVLQHVTHKGTDGHRVCYSAYHFRLVRLRFGGYVVRVKHGGGEEEWNIGHEANMVNAMRALTSDARFHMMHTLMDCAREAAKGSAHQTATRYQRAFVDGRLKKRKLRGQDSVRVWIDPEVRS